MLLSAAEYCTRKYSCGECNTPLLFPLILFISMQKKFNADSCHSPSVFARVIKQVLLFIAPLRAHPPVSRCECIWVYDKLIWYREPIRHALRESIAVINVEASLSLCLHRHKRLSPRDRFSSLRVI
jgi:hypothetical protein